MYSGPFYYHQPGHNQHNSASELLTSGIGDGLIILVKTTQKGSQGNFEQFVLNCKRVNKNILFDTEDFIPEITDNIEWGSEILLDNGARNQYVSQSLKFQNDNDCSAYIIPNFEALTVSQKWFETLPKLSITGKEWIINNGNDKKQVFLTIAIPADYIIDKSNCQNLVDRLTLLRSYVDGFYINLVGIPEILVNKDLFYNLLYLVFRLKWQQFKVIFSKASSWIGTMFPLGLDTFGSGGSKSQQQVRSKRNEKKSHGRGGQKYINIWSPISLSYIRYPDDAEKLHYLFNQEEKKNIYGIYSGYAPPIDMSPDEVYRSGIYKKNRRLNHYSSSMANLAKEYQNLSLNERITLVQRQLREAFRLEQQIGNALGNTNRGQEKQIWFDVFTKFVDDNRDDLEEMYT